MFWKPWTANRSVIAQQEHILSVSIEYIKAWSLTTTYLEVLLNGVSNYQELHHVYGSLTIVENTPVLLPGTIIWELPWEIFALSSVSHTCSVRELSQNTIFLFKGVDIISPTSLKEKSIKLEMLSCHGSVYKYIIYWYCSDERFVTYNITKPDT